MTLLRSDARTLKQGDAAPLFSLRNVDGSMVHLDDFSGKAVVLIFMCNHCPYVKPKMEEIARLQDDFAGKGVVVICINANDPTDYPEDDAEHMKEVAHKFGYHYYLIDETQEVARAYGATCTPDPFVFDREHKLVYHGRINDAMNPEDVPTEHTLRNVIGMMLSGEAVRDWFVPSMGCSIKWR